MERKGGILEGSVIIALLFSTGCTLTPGMKDGDKLVVDRNTLCYQYPGGEGAGTLRAPWGQEAIGMIEEGSEVRVDQSEYSLFGPTSGIHWVRVEAPVINVNNMIISPTDCWADTLALSYSINH